MTFIIADNIFDILYELVKINYFKLCDSVTIITLIKRIYGQIKNNYFYLKNHSIHHSFECVF